MKVEYSQLNSRCVSLNSYILNIKDGEITQQELKLLKQQFGYMTKYRDALAARCRINNVEI